MDDVERRKLEALLDHWAKHGLEHGEEFREWAGRVEDARVSGPMLEAAQHMEKAGGYLLNALEVIRKQG
ncbi:hypothetical protein ACFLX5_02570 [Chloroflexota bacterium]